jgi:hypothetical protein
MGSGQRCVSPRWRVLRLALINDLIFLPLVFLPVSRSSYVRHRIDNILSAFAPWGLTVRLASKAFTKALALYAGPG